MHRAAVIALTCSLAGSALAVEFRLGSPIACQTGEDARCYIQHFVDRDSSAATRDFMCRDLTYDTHGGTDFALRSLAEMQAGVDVLAAAPGTVRGVRDGLDDRAYDPARDAARLDGRDCGNGVVLAHDGGWETQYCHLRSGSVAVQPGTAVAAGTVLGQVGMSGRAQFPHLHLHLRKDGAAVDPFAPDPRTDCGVQEGTLWADPPPYQPGGLISAGFAAGIPDYADIKAGTAHEQTLGSDAPALVLWGFAFGSRPGDALRLDIRDPSGARIFAQTITLERAQAQVFRAAGRRTASNASLAPGTYRGTVEMLRGGAVISDMSTELRVISR